MSPAHQDECTLTPVPCNLTPMHFVMIRVPAPPGKLLNFQIGRVSERACRRGSRLLQNLHADEHIGRSGVSHQFANPDIASTSFCIEFLVEVLFV